MRIVKKPVNDKHHNAFMRCAFEFAKLSHAKRLQVGCIIVKNDRIISIGYNGTPAGWDNTCEIPDPTYVPVGNESPPLITRPEVVHAEANAIAKLARYGDSADCGTVYITHSPCIECAKQLLTAGIVEVRYAQKYRNDLGLEFLEKGGVSVVHQPTAE